MIEPNRRELELADCYSYCQEDAHVLAIVLATYREELLKPFDELRQDALAYRDETGARVLGELLKTARGAS